MRTSAAIPTDQQMAMYDDKSFVPSYELQDPHFANVL
jgi:hypothetical protein